MPSAPRPLTKCKKIVENILGKPVNAMPPTEIQKKRNKILNKEETTICR
jgi:hypothetical protein